MQESTALRPDHGVDATGLELALRELAPEQVVAGRPRVGAVELGSLKDCSVGVWEITPGVSTDVETDEWFVVLGGHAEVAFDDGTPPLQLRPGTVARLRAGSRTTWTVTQTLRKVYIV